MKIYALKNILDSIYKGSRVEGYEIKIHIPHIWLFISFTSEDQEIYCIFS